jgi:hypothetical protein
MEAKEAEANEKKTTPTIIRQMTKILSSMLVGLVSP